MQMNQTPSSERVHIGFFGRRNAGKSSVLNAVTGQDLAVAPYTGREIESRRYCSRFVLPVME